MARGDQIARAVRANKIFTDGMAKAVQDSYDAFAATVTKGTSKFDQNGFDNPLLEGSLRGWISLLDGATKAWFDASTEFLKAKP